MSWSATRPSKQFAIALVTRSTTRRPKRAQRWRTTSSCTMWSASWISSSRPPMAELPTRTFTFLFTDIEGSTRLWEEHPEAMKGALARHDEILREAVESHGGHVVKTTGDGVHAAFATAHEAVGAA